MNVIMTESLKQFFWKFHRKELALVLMGHTELVTEYWDEYTEWCLTDEGKQYLQGGSLYKEPK